MRSCRLLGLSNTLIMKFKSPMSSKGMQLHALRHQLRFENSVPSPSPGERTFRSDFDNFDPEPESLHKLLLRRPAELSCATRSGNLI